ncbi:MAG: gfo/Idh/MocA family oxidoreductase [Calditrichaeota bacterium]|nr:MAG: gfo/Idh/MocA family oxidoreductase [Calditrichota bacterium]
MVRIGIVGLGYWGPNFERTFTNLPDSEITAICDLNEDRLNYGKEKIPEVFTTQNLEEMLDKDRIDALVVSTPTKTHFEITKKALEAGLHVFVEKPLATSALECQILVDLAEKFGLILFVGHLFLYNTAVKKMKELVTSGDLGNICYMSSQRLNLGPIRQDVNALWDLAPHDISIMLDFIGSPPVSVNCQGLAYLNEKVHDVCTLTMHFEPKCMAIINVSWLDPSKTRLMTIVGEQKMATFNDMEPLEKIRVYNKRVEAPSYSDSFGEFQFAFQYGDTLSPWLHQVEPLKAECQQFLNCVQNDTQPLTDGQNGLDVVKVLEAADISLHNNGEMVELNDIKQFSPADTNGSVKGLI